MLFEGLAYADDFPMNISIVHMVEDPRHYHVDIEFVYVLRGEIQLKNGCHQYELHEGDIFTNTGHEVHSLKSLSDDNVVAIIQISTHYFSHYFPNLSKSCYRTYSKEPTDKRHNWLRGLLLQILLKYSVKNFNYKRECTSLIVDTIKYLDKYFNLFAFDKDLVVSFNRGNPVAVERISMIYTYIYQYYADNITLEDISEMEHLSTYYLSHLIKSYTGMNFRDLLCFARVEWSEIKLLESGGKISQIARDVGFSTTAYYKKYFEKWFKTSPQEYRLATMPLIKSELRPAVTRPLDQEEAVAVIKMAYAAHNLRQGDGAVIASHNLEADININRTPLFRLDKRLVVKVTVDDYRAQGISLLEALNSLSPWKVAVLKRECDYAEDIQVLARRLRREGFSVEKRAAEGRERAASFAYDSIAYPIHLIKKYIRAEQPQIELFLRDVDYTGRILQGQDAAVTASGIRKPAFYAWQILSKIKGDVLYKGNQYCVIRTAENGPVCFVVLLYNAGEAVREICLKNTDAYQTKNVINDFKDEVNIRMHLNLKPGMYSIVKYSMDRETNIFAYLAALDFQDAAVAPSLCAEAFSGAPALEVYLEDVRTVFNLNSSIKGAGFQAVVIKPLKGAR